MNTPTLRFKEFSGEWEVKKLGTETTWNSGGTPSKQEESYWDGDIPWISASSMRGFKYFDSDLKITNAGLSNGSRLATTGSLLLLVRGSMLFNKIPVGIATKDVAFNQDVKSIKTKPSINNEFLLYWFFASENKLLNMVSGTGIGAGKLDTQDLLAMDLSIPTIPEQTKIANFLTAIDDKIAQLSQTAQLLTDYKKGVMQQIFSQQLRFKDDDGREFAEWEEGKLDDAFSYKNGKSFENEVIENGDFYLITLNSIDISGKLKGEHKRVSKSDNSLIKNDLIMVLSDVAHGNFLGLTDIIPSNNYVLNQRMGGLRAKINIDVKFASLYINYHQKYFKLHGQGSSQLNLSKGDVLDFDLPRPCVEEQTKIANFLTAIDDKLNHNQTQLDAMKQYKSGLLQQMFV